MNICDVDDDCLVRRHWMVGGGSGAGRHEDAGQWAASIEGGLIALLCNTALNISLVVELLLTNISWIVEMHVKSSSAKIEIKFSDLLSCYVTR